MANNQIYSISRIEKNDALYSNTNALMEPRIAADF